MPFPFDPSPAVLWTLTNDDKLASCEIAFVPTGVETRIMRNGKLLYARRFPNGDATLEWAEAERVEMLRAATRIRSAPNPSVAQGTLTTNVTGDSFAYRALISQHPTGRSRAVMMKEFVPSDTPCAGSARIAPTVAG
jgi:hypothetical protein